jgi:hypothetical protein
VHHLSYRRLGREQMRDLVLLCLPCHDRVHRFARRSPLTLRAATRISIVVHRSEQIGVAVLAGVAAVTGLVLILREQLWR